MRAKRVMAVSKLGAKIPPACSPNVLPWYQLTAVCGKGGGKCSVWMGMYIGDTSEGYSLSGLMQSTMAEGLSLN